MRWGMVIDLDRCTACGACAVACAQENNTPPGSAREAASGRLIRWLELLSVESGTYPRVDARIAPMPCQHCDSAPCTKVCPVYATYRNPEGLVPQVYAQCIGCRYCVNACPYTAKLFNWTTPTWPGAMARGLNPDVSVRTAGVAEKCNFCLHRLQRARDEAAAKGRAFVAGDYRTACEEACPAKAIRFGDLDDPEGAAFALAGDHRRMRMLEELGTEPKVIYLKDMS